MAKILIMDDEPGLRNVVFGMLKPTGHQLFVTEDGTQAIETAKKERPDLALLDMRVPDYDGLEVLAHLKKMDPNIRCIMLSGFGDVETAVSAMKEGAFDYISKPFKLEEVLRVVNKALNASPAQAGAPQTSAPTAPTMSGKPSSAPKVSVNVPKRYTPPKVKALRAITFTAIALALGAGGYFGWKQFSGASQAVSASIPYSNPSAIAWDGQNLWISDWASQSVYRHKTDKNLSIVNVATLGDEHPTGLAWDGQNLWSCSALEKKITKHNMDANLSAAVAFPNPLQEPSALAWDGINLWCADGAGGKLYKLRPVGEGLNVAGEFAGTATTPAGMFFAQNALWVADAETGKIYQQDPTTLSVLGVYGLEPYASKMERISGMSFDGQNIWTCTQKSSKVYRHSFTSLKKLNL